MNNKNINSMEALELLMEGNLRFASGLRSVENFGSISKLKELAEKGQSPFAVVLTCSDSRVPTEIIFDQGFGDLFVIRVAGNIVAPSIIGSIEFAASNFGTPLCIVMGHSQCGAIKAAVNAEIERQADCPSNVGTIVKKVRPAVRAVSKTLGRHPKTSEFQRWLQLSTNENICRSAAAITRKSPVLKALMDQKKFAVVGALYDLHTGQVNFDLTKELVPLPQRPDRQLMLASSALAELESFENMSNKGKASTS